MPHEDFDIYVDVLAMVAKTVGEEHTLNMKGGAFWNMLGTMAEIQLPLFVLHRSLDRLFAPSSTAESSGGCMCPPGPAAAATLVQPAPPVCCPQVPRPSPSQLSPADT